MLDRHDSAPVVVVSERRIGIARSSRFRRRESDLAIALSALRLASALRRLGIARRALAAAKHGQQ